MSHPLRDTVPAVKCDCGRYAPAGHPCPGCGAVNGPHRGHDPETPPGAEAALGTYRDDLGEARRMLREARDAELTAKSARDKARRRAQLSPDCPKVGVFDGARTTVAYVQAWLDEQVAGLDEAYQVAKVARQAASDHLHTVGEQGRFQQSITASVRESYRGQRGTGW